MIRLLALLLVFQLTGCMSFEISSNSNETENSKNASETVHGTVWGDWYWKKHNIQKCHDGSLARVEFTYLAHQLLASALTLGLYVPQTVEWWCEDTDTSDDSSEQGLSREGEGR